MKLILASSSPRRRDLLRQAGFEFQVSPSSAEESVKPGEAAEVFARRAARDKALNVAAHSPAGAIVLGADTVVAINEEIFGKPADAADAERMLGALSGVTHRVITGLCLIEAPRREIAWTSEETLVTFRRLDANEIRAYIESGEPFGKAGAYAIQGLASRFVTRIEGCYFNVVGLPIARLYDALKPLPR